MKLGATYTGGGRTEFLVWASHADRVAVVLDGDREVPLEPAPRGYFSGVVEDAPPGSRYRYRLDDERLRPDPCSRWQPEGVHGPSAVVDPAFAWTDDAWRGLPLSDHVIYELHVGTFTNAGTFDGVIDHLDELVDLGITAVELMPIAEFPGHRNWGYDGVLPYAAQSSYGGPDGLRRLVDACHARGLAVLLDVVYNHFGPEGAHQSDFAEYFTERYGTPWGPALNFDGPGSGEVRRYFIENALYWIDGCHIDGLRLDAVHAILDQSAYHFLHELSDTVHAYADRANRRVHVVAESDLNDPRLIRVPEVGGYGLDAQWSDDFHHALHAVLTGESGGYYADFGSPGHLATALRHGYVLRGGYSAHRGRAHGAPTTGIPGERFVVCAQNHDQVGNRMLGERLASLVDTESVKVAAACVVLAPYIPLLFMGEEYAERAPFQYFVSHTDEDLVAAVREGRREEFAAFAWQGQAPDPEDPATFRRSTLDHERKHDGDHAAVLSFHRRLLELRRQRAALRSTDRERLVVWSTAEGLVSWRRWTAGGDEALVAANVGTAAAGLLLDPATVDPVAEPPVDERTRWRKVLDSTAASFGGDGGEQGSAPGQVGHGEAPKLPPRSVVVYVRHHEAPPP